MTPPGAARVVGSIRRVRRATPFDGDVIARHPLLWPLARPAAAFAGATAWPPVSAWRAVFAGDAPVDFVVAAPRPRRGRRPPLDGGALYDASITERRRVPSRERNWHDFFNALVWGAFPRAKAALHRRQRALIAARIDPAAPRLPPHRTREQDGLAMIDEGGALALEAPGAELRLVFGHAIYEGFVLGVPNMTARLVRLSIGALDDDPVAQADRALAARLDDATQSTDPRELARAFVPDDAVAPWLPSR